MSKHLLWTEWETSTANKDNQNLGFHRVARDLNDMQRKLIDEQCCKSISDEVKIWKFIHNIPDIIKKSITGYLTNDMPYNDIVNETDQFEGGNRVANAAHAKPRYYSQVLR